MDWVTSNRTSTRFSVGTKIDSRRELMFKLPGGTQLLGTAHARKGHCARRPLRHVHHSNIVAAPYSIQQSTYHTLLNTSHRPSCTLWERRL